MLLPKWIAKWFFKTSAIVAEEGFNEERAGLPQRRVGYVRIYGQDKFTKQVVDALSQLERAYPYGYSLVQRYVRGIMQTNTPPELGALVQVVCRSCTPDGDLPMRPNRFAANLVRHAVVWRKQTAFGLTRSVKSQIQSLNRELHAMRLLGCDQKYFHRMTNLILNFEKR